MAEERVERRLSAILAADIAGVQDRVRGCQVIARAEAGGVRNRQFGDDCHIFLATVRVAFLHVALRCQLSPMQDSDHEKRSDL